MTRRPLALALSFSVAGPGAGISLKCSGCADPAVQRAKASAAPALRGGASRAAEGPTEVIVRAEDDGKSFDVATGDPVTFELASNAGPGYVWMLTGVDPAVLSQLGERSSEPSSDVDGTSPVTPEGGRHMVDVYRFVALRPGWTAPEIILQRPWTKSAAPSRSIHVIVNVH
jgi:predicted secreted protein